MQSNFSTYWWWMVPVLLFNHKTMITYLNMLFVLSGGTVKFILVWKAASCDGQGPMCGLPCLSAKSGQEYVSLWSPNLTQWPSRRTKLSVDFTATSIPTNPIEEYTDHPARPVILLGWKENCKVMSFCSGFISCALIAFLALCGSTLCKSLRMRLSSIVPKM